LTSTTISTGPQRILIADDTASSRDLLRSILESSNYEVADAMDGAQALEMASAFKPHLVILDLHMPRLDGYATAQALRKLPMLQQTPIVALTAAITQTSPEKIAQAGFSAYLVKPIGPAKLRQCVAKMLQPR
jgi:two-component system cell cycle response regulator DivK